MPAAALLLLKPSDWISYCICFVFCENGIHEALQLSLDLFELSAMDLIITIDDAETAAGNDHMFRSSKQECNGLHGADVHVSRS